LEDLSKLVNLLSDIKTIFRKVESSTPTRIVCVHTCWPDSQFLRVFTKLFILRATTSDDGDGSYSSIKVHKVKFHFGNNTEIHSNLKRYGIPIGLLPMTRSGVIKINYHKQWMKTISLICKQQQHQHDPSSSNITTATNTIIAKERIIVECPSFNDVVFRIGQTSIENPGNVKFRSMILTYLENEDYTGYSNKVTLRKNKPMTNNSSNNGDGNNGKSKSRHRSFVDWIIDETDKRNGRFLEWDDTNKCWVQMIKKTHIERKVGPVLYSRTKRRVKDKVSSNRIKIQKTSHTPTTSSLLQYYRL